MQSAFLSQSLVWGDHLDQSWFHIALLFEIQWACCFHPSLHCRDMSLCTFHREHWRVGIQRKLAKMGCCWVVENFVLQPSQCDEVFKIYNPHRSRSSSLNSTADKTVPHILFGVATNHVPVPFSLDNLDALSPIYRSYFQHLSKSPQIFPPSQPSSLPLLLSSYQCDKQRQKFPSPWVSQ